MTIEEFEGYDSERVLLVSESLVSIIGLDWLTSVKTVGPNLHVLETLAGTILLHGGRPVAAHLKDKRDLIDPTCLAAGPLSLIKKWAGPAATPTDFGYLMKIIVQETNE